MVKPFAFSVLLLAALAGGARAAAPPSQAAYVLQKDGRGNAVFIYPRLFDFLDETDTTGAPIGTPHPISQHEPLPTQDIGNKGYNFAGVPAPMTPGTLYSPSAGLGLVCTQAGNISLVTGGYTWVIPIGITTNGPILLGLSVTEINVAGTTAACTYLALN